MIRSLTIMVSAVLIGAIGAHGGPTFLGPGITMTTSNQRVLGTSAFAGFYPGYFNGIGIFSPYDWRYALMYTEDGSWYWIMPAFDGMPLIERVQREDPALVAAIIGPQLPEPDPGLVDLREGRYEDAAAVFRRDHAARVRAEARAQGVAIPDRSALRLEALALAGAGEWQRAAELFAEAHDQDPLLGSDPIDGDRVLGSSMEARRIMLGAMEFAKRENTADAWAMVGYLMQVQGRYGDARAMVARAASMR